MDTVSRVRLLKSTSIFLLTVLLVISSISCIPSKLKTQSDSPSNPLSNILNKILGKISGEAKFEYVEGVGEVMLTLTYPVGQSPKVFTEGWLFGASCIVNKGQADQKDMSKQVKWSGSGKFSPSIGETSRPSFDMPGKNSIVLSVSVGNKEVTQEYTIDTVRPDNYGKIGDYSKCDNPHSHSCPACPHNSEGAIVTGSTTVFIKGNPAARVGDTGVAAACCGPNTFEIVGGDPNVIIDGRRAARWGDKTLHCGAFPGHIMLTPSKSPPVEKYWVRSERTVDAPTNFKESFKESEGDHDRTGFRSTTSYGDRELLRTMTFYGTDIKYHIRETKKPHGSNDVVRDEIFWLEFNMLPVALNPGNKITVNWSGRLSGMLGASSIYTPTIATAIWVKGSETPVTKTENMSIKSTNPQQSKSFQFTVPDTRYEKFAIILTLDAIIGGRTTYIYKLVDSDNK